MENINQFLISEDLEYITEKDILSVRKDVNIISHMINNVGVSVGKRNTKP